MTALLDYVSDQLKAHSIDITKAVTQAINI